MDESVHLSSERGTSEDARRRQPLVFMPRLFLLSCLGFLAAAGATGAWVARLVTAGEFSAWMTPAAALIVAIVGLSSTAGLMVTVMQTWRDRALALAPFLVGVALLFNPLVDEAAATGLLQLHDSECPVEDFELRSIDGETFRLSEMRERVVLVDVWRTWCGPCLHELPMLDYAQRLLDEDGLVVLGVSDEPEELQRPIGERYGVSYPLLVDDGSLPRPFRGVNAFPTTFLIDREGCLVPGHVRALGGLRRLMRAVRGSEDDPFPLLAPGATAGRSGDGT